MFMVMISRSKGKRKVQGVPQSQKGKRKVQGVPQLQTAALPRHREEEETDKSKQHKSIKHTKNTKISSQTAALPRHQEEEKTDKSKQAQIEQTYEKH